MMPYHSIRVADAPLLDRSRRVPDRMMTEAEPRTGLDGKRTPFSPLFAALLVLALSFTSKFLYVHGAEVLLPLLTLARYLLWPAVIAAVAVHLSRRGTADLRKNIGYMLPFLGIGVVSALLGIWPVQSLREIVFWLLCTLCAAVVGAEVSARTVRSVVFWSFLTMISTCVAAVILFPGIATETGTRYDIGLAWVGLFPGKNAFGIVCVYAIEMALFAQAQGRPLRIFAGGLAAISLIFAASQGAVVTTVAACGYLALIAMLRRSRLSMGLRAGILATTTLSAVVGLYLFAGSILELLGRDPTLTGRTYIWSAFLERAMYVWPIGAGPGSFSNGASPYVFDLAYRFRDFGVIQTPHNMYIMALGEIGLFGLIAFITPILYFAFVLPFRKEQASALAVATVAFTMLIGGMSEAREVLGISLNMFLLVLMVSVMHRADREAAAGDGREPGGAMAGAARADTGYEPRLLGT